METLYGQNRIKFMKEITITCDRCGKVINGGIDEHNGITITAGYYDVAKGYWSKFARWEEEFICDLCMHSDPKYVKSYTG